MPNTAVETHAAHNPGLRARIASGARARLAVPLALALSATLCGPALAQPAVAPVSAQTNVAPQDWLSLSQIATRLSEAGYRVIELDMERNSFDAELVDRDGKILSARVHPVTGALINSRVKGTATLAADPKWQTVAQIAAGLEKQGYIVRKVDSERDGYDVELTDRNGRQIDALVDPVSGAIVHSELD